MFNKRLQFYAILASCSYARDMLSLQNEGDFTNFSEKDENKALALGDRAFRNLLSLCKEFGLKPDEDELNRVIFESDLELENYLAHLIGERFHIV